MSTVCKNYVFQLAKKDDFVPEFFVYDLISFKISEIQNP